MTDNGIRINDTVISFLRINDNIIFSRYIQYNIQECSGVADLLNHCPVLLKHYKLNN